MKALRYLVISAIALSALNVMRTPSNAIPAWGRKYGVDCSACHSPAVPRLNREGHQFRKMGFRMPTEIGKQPEYKEIGEYLSFRQRTRFSVDQNPGGAVAPTKNQFQFNDITTFYEGPVNPYLTTMIELERPNAGTGNENGLEVQYFGSWTMGDLGNYWSVRAGNMRTVRLGYGGFDRPTGISTPLILSKDLTTGTFTTSSNIGGTSVGVEINRGWKEENRLFLQITNGNSGESEDVTTGGLDKNFILGYERLLDDRGSAFTLYASKGTSHLTPTQGAVAGNSWAFLDTAAFGGNGNGTVSSGEAATATGDDNLSQVDYTRLGATFSWLSKPQSKKDLPFEIQGGYMRGNDDAPDNVPTTSSITGDGWYVQLQKNLPKNAAVFARYDFVDKGSPTTKDNLRQITVGLVRDISNNWKMSAELQHIVDETKPENENLLTVESMINF